LRCLKPLDDRFPQPARTLARMTEQQNLLTNPYFRYGQAAMSAVVIAAMAFLVVEDGTMRMLMLSIAALDVVVTPQILKRAGENAAGGTGSHDV
jgi:hypothetical protein